MAADPLELDAPLDVGLLADFLEAIEAGRPPSQAALEEVAPLVEARALVARELRRRRALLVVAAVRSANPGASGRTIAQLAARRLGEDAERVRWWVRTAGDSTQDLRDADARKEP